MKRNAKTATAKHSRVAGQCISRYRRAENQRETDDIFMFTILTARRRFVVPPAERLEVASC